MKKESVLKLIDLYRNFYSLEHGLMNVLDCDGCEAINFPLDNLVEVIIDELDLHGKDDDVFDLFTLTLDCDVDSEYIYSELLGIKNDG